MGRRLRKREKQSVAASMSELPESVIDDILSRLPVKDLLRFRCVSKRWCALIDSPMFIKLQLNRSLETKTNLSLILVHFDINSVDLDMLDGVLKLGGGSVPRLDVVEVDNPIKSEDYCTTVACSCNGLICLQIDEAIALLNPSTKEYIILPPMPPPNGLLDTFHGIVYDPVGDDYKVVMIVQFFDDSHSHFSQVMVYGLRSNTWRQICESFTYHLYWHWVYDRNPGVLVNGALHWLGCRDRVDLFDIVVAFDPVDEKHREVQVPQVPSCSYGTLGVLGGCLCILYAINEEEDEEDDSEFTVELWVMNDYMVQESWTKLFTLPMPPLNHREVNGLQCVRVLAYAKSSRDVILLHLLGNLIWYDLKEDRVLDLGIDAFAAHVNVKSLVKLSHYK